ncbi:TetR/AcrR family transcriptional regulator [Mycobacterium sp. 852002-51057_SCH5723018]|uniref:TetR/AcrR family transcriptional regulator n=1 Tax=Mycobacterium sp. 852002-51057_SCH5723018 TaxID=1834094 RepID=UPI0007FD59CD|nr:TetR/AcrR family transcriptional regulator [Mycobacterium sp. 852002-51057_SCH5723018]OBG24603.1 TetR family transcriptional regulator [Mycobacterium sp. 852002-51057_SCH5723018]
MARYDSSHKSETRRRIVDSAGRRLKRDGIDGSGIAALMSDAGLTNGAFYAHFKSKNDLVANVVADQLALQAATMKALLPGGAAIEQFIREYLSPSHRDQPASGCPSAALLDEIGRCDEEIRGSYTSGVQSIIDAVASQLSPRDPAAGRKRATGLFTLIVGSLQLARAVTDPALSDEVLETGISTAIELLNLDRPS